MRDRCRGRLWRGRPNQYFLTQDQIMRKDCLCWIGCFECFDSFHVDDGCAIWSDCGCPWSWFNEPQERRSSHVSSFRTQHHLGCDQPCAIFSQLDDTAHPIWRWSRWRQYLTLYRDAYGYDRCLAWRWTRRPPPRPHFLLLLVPLESFNHASSPS